MNLLLGDEYSVFLFLKMIVYYNLIRGLFYNNKPFLKTTEGEAFETGEYAEDVLAIYLEKV